MAIASTKPWRRHDVDSNSRSPGVITVSFGHAAHDAYTSFLPPLLPALMEKFSLSATQAGLLSVCMQWPSLLQPFIGFAADRTNLRLLFILGPALSAAGMSLLGVAPSYAVLALLLMAVGIGQASLHAVGPVIATNVGRHRLGRSIGVWMVGGTLGATLGPLVIVAALSTLKLEGTPWLMFGGIMASMVLYVRLRGVSSTSGAQVQDHPWRQVLAALKPLMFPVVTITIMRSFMGTALTTFLPLFLKSEGSNLWFAGAALSIYFAVGMVGSFFAGALSDRMGRRRVLMFAMALSAPLMALFMMTQGAARLPLLVLIALCSQAVLPVMMALMQEQMPQHRALANGFYMGLNFLTNAGAALAFGFLTDRLGMRLVFLISALLPLLTLPLAARLPAGTREA